MAARGVVPTSAIVPIPVLYRRTSTVPVFIAGVFSRFAARPSKVGFWDTLFCFVFSSFFRLELCLTRVGIDLPFYQDVSRVL